ncbi:phosphotransferase family protein [Pseudoalteromonas sp. PAB 2.2]|uniref:phosphotransferase family protein n=1 Tax=Pseudoalteromonas sp. PAB 2.2 TaxID=1841508 RepID=UPI00094F6DA9|nr:phosphotransferase [Pseudoalteromonas sp. PAB 2.2]
MKTEQQINALFSRFDPALTITSISPLVEGLSNDNYLVKTATNSYLVKHYRDHWPAVGLAAQTHFAKQSCCPAPLWLEQATDTAIFDYVEGRIASGDFCDSLLPDLVNLHLYPLLTEPMDIAYEINCYQHTTRYQQHLTLIEESLAYIANAPKDMGFCHNDLVKENIIVNNSGMFLIDFEYAKSNDVYFDLAALVVSFQLNTEQQQALLEQYRTLVSAHHEFTLSLNKLAAFQGLFLLLCICWYEQRGAMDKVAPLLVQLHHFIKQQKR